MSIDFILEQGGGRGRGPMPRITAINDDHGKTCGGESVGDQGTDNAGPELNGLKATEKLKGMCPHLKILTLTRHTDDGYLQQLLKVGASGYVLKQSASSELIRAIRTVSKGNTYIDPALTKRVINSFVSGRPARGTSAGKDLTGREEEVLRLIAWGHSNKEIAARLSLSVKTVEAHKTNAMQKMGMKGRIDIALRALARLAPRQLTLFVSFIRENPYQFLASFRYPNIPPGG